MHSFMHSFIQRPTDLFISLRDWFVIRLHLIIIILNYSLNYNIG